MATEDDDYHGDPLSGGSFTQLLESDDVGPGPGPFLEGGPFRPSSPSHDGSHAKMLCFGYDSQNEGEMGFFEAAGVQLVVGQKKGISAGNSCSTSSSSGLSKSRKAGNAGGGGRKTEEKGGVVSGSDVCATAESSRKEVKKAKTKPTCSSSSSAHHRPSKKEKLGERIIALQKLVSPYGKTDTASVLHEAMGYIRFLHDQVQVLSSPYLQRLPSSSAKLPQEEAEEEEGGEAESRYNLRSRGLCLVPVECTVHVARSNGADLWSPAMATNPSNR